MVAILDSSVNCVCMWSTKKLTVSAYCVAVNCNNSQTTPGITLKGIISQFSVSFNGNYVKNQPNLGLVLYQVHLQPSSSIEGTDSLKISV